MLRALVAASALALAGCSSLATLTGGYAHSLSGEHAGGGGPALHAAVGAGSGARGDGAGFGMQLRYKNVSHAREVALGGHIYLLQMQIEEHGRVFNKTSPWGGYSRVNLNLIEFERYEEQEFESSLGPSLDVGMLMPFGLTLAASIERDVRFAGAPDETFVLFMVGFGVGGVGPF